MDYPSIIHALVDDFVENKEAILIRELPNENPVDLTFLIVANGEDTSRLIGRRGIIADALREVISIAGKIDNRRVHLKFEAFEKITTED
jgi:predicted RNA-binding protein YlqC (UPF0109 family)